MKGDSYVVIIYMTHPFSTICIIYSVTLLEIFKHCISKCEAEIVETFEYDAKHTFLTQVKFGKNLVHSSWSNFKKNHLHNNFIHTVF